jgi:hypothetical protein
MVIEEYKTVRENLIQKLSDEEYEGLQSDEEYYYIAGQCISYMCGKYVHVNKLLKKNLVSKELRLSKDNEQLRKRLKNMLFNKCGDIIYLEDSEKFNNCFAMLMGYIPDTNVINRDYLELGYLENSIL